MADPFGFLLPMLMRFGSSPWYIIPHFSTIRRNALIIVYMVHQVFTFRYVLLELCLQWHFQIGSGASDITFTLANEVLLENLSLMLVQNRITQIYAKVVGIKVSGEMQKLKERLFQRTIKMEMK